ncbi:unnamed protein product [Orchesella dallaii]|uniref:Peptidase S1 domain-containing protein n=1 Tax=Orchesella dallaii TaxID=48710 RepID=A0ABP1RPN3_9HEXA
METDESGLLPKLLKTALLPVVDQSTCEKSLRRDISPNTKLCAGYTNGTGTCKGDSGSGLVFSQRHYASNRNGGKEPERFYIHGIVSNSAKLEGTNECDDKNYSVFTKISAFVEWVQETINKYEI